MNIFRGNLEKKRYAIYIYTEGTETEYGEITYVPMLAAFYRIELKARELAAKWGVGELEKVHCDIFEVHGFSLYVTNHGTRLAYGETHDTKCQQDIYPVFEFQLNADVPNDIHFVLTYMRPCLDLVYTVNKYTGKTTIRRMLQVDKFDDRAISDIGPVHEDELLVHAVYCTTRDYIEFIDDVTPRGSDQIVYRKASDFHTGAHTTEGQDIIGLLKTVPSTFKFNVPIPVSIHTTANAAGDALVAAINLMKPDNDK